MASLFASSGDPFVDVTVGVGNNTMVPTSSIFESSGAVLDDDVGGGSSIFHEFERTRLTVLDKRKQRFRCFEHVSKQFLLWCVFVIKTSIALVVVCAFALTPEINAHTDVRNAFLMLLACVLNVRPNFGMFLLALYDLPLLVIIQVLATSTAFLLPLSNPLIAFIIGWGVFAFHYADWTPGVQKIGSAIWLLTLLARATIPTISGTQLVLNAQRLMISICLAFVAAGVGTLIPPFTATKMTGGKFQETCQHLSRYLSHLADQYEYLGTAHDFANTRMATETKLRQQSMPSFVSSSPHLVSNVVEDVASGDVSSADVMERMDTSAERARVSIDGMMAMVWRGAVAFLFSLFSFSHQ